MSNYPTITATFLGSGTSSGVPMIGCPCAVCQSKDVRDNRLRSSLLIQSAQTTLVIDTGPDFRIQMLNNQVSDLNAVLITHSHKDHIAGLDDVRAFNFFHKKSIPVFGTYATLERLKVEFYYVFNNDGIPGKPLISLEEINHIPFKINDLEIIPIPVWHYKMPVLGFRFGNLTYITDANAIDQASKELIRGSKVLIVNALRKEKHISHFTLAEAIALGNELGIPEVYFTHISHQMGLHQSVSETLPKGFFLGFDGLRIKC